MASSQALTVTKPGLSLFTFLHFQLCSNFSLPFELSWFLPLQNPLSSLPQAVSVDGPSCCETSEIHAKDFSLPSTSEIQSAEAGGCIKHPVLLSPKLRFLLQILINVGLAILSPVFPPYQLSTWHLT